ncbi:MAG TPA: signal peptidase I [Gaiellaceae bacterium]|nr:signal peptidase I [Gaiellaceae bacterium]
MRAAPRRKIGIRRILGWLQIAVALGVIVFWFVALRPAAWGGPAGYAFISGRSMLPKYHTGDVVIVHRHSSYHRGEVIAYRIPAGNVGAGLEVIHRIIGGNGRTGFLVQGDNRTTPDVWRPKTTDVVGSAWVHIPQASRFIKLLHSPLVLAGLAAFIAFGAVLRHGAKKPEEDESEPGASGDLMLLRPEQTEGSELERLSAELEHLDGVIDELVKSRTAIAQARYWLLVQEPEAEDQSQSH